MASRKVIKSAKDVPTHDIPILVLEPHPRSNQSAAFEPKRLDLIEAVKVGRKTSPKLPPEPHNGIFDSKVLSRAHAEICCSEDGAKVLIRDVGSSNGTFVNGTRLGNENQPSEWHEIRDGDNIDFGVDITGDQGELLFSKVACVVKIVRGSDVNATSSVSAQSAQSGAATAESGIDARTSQIESKENFVQLQQRFAEELRRSAETTQTLQNLQNYLDIVEKNVDQLPQVHGTLHAQLDEALSQNKLLTEKLHIMTDLLDENAALKKFKDEAMLKYPVLSTLQDTGNINENKQASDKGTTKDVQADNDKKLQDALQEKENILSELQESETQRQALQSRIDEFEMQVLQLTTRIKTLEATKEELSSKHSEATEALQEAVKRGDDLEAKLIKLEAETSNENEELKKSLLQMENDLKEMQGLLNASKEDVLKLKNTERALTEELETESKQGKSLTTKLAKLEEELNATKAELTSTLEKLSTAQDETKSSRTQLEQAKRLVRPALVPLVVFTGAVAVLLAYYSQKLL